LAGGAGADRAISWAHTIELPHPWEWLEKGDLLMTVGLGIPREPAEQVVYVESLAAVGVSGVAIGEDMLAPPLSDEMLQAADERSLPILITAYEVPFIQISRTVAGTNQGPEHLRLVKTVRIYDSVRAATVRSSSPAELLRTLSDEIDADLAVCTNERADLVFPDTTPLPSPTRDAFVAALAARQPQAMPGILRLAVDGRTALVVPVPARRPVSLIAVARASDAPPYAILQHIATIAALEYERLIAAREELRRLGGETLAGLLDGRLSANVATPQLRSHGLEDTPMVVVVGEPAGPATSSLHHALGDRGVAHMFLQRSPVLYCLVADDEAVVSIVCEALASEDVRMGVSDPFTDLDRFRSAVREARWALGIAQAESRGLVRYGEQLAGLGPRSLAEAGVMVERVLGPVLAYDREHGSDLVRSLAVFLRCNRSWQEAAAELFVHKQTLVYRMRRVEELTGRRLGDTGTIAEFWLAVSAADLVS
jgi:purine catabolism regulator